MKFLTTLLLMMICSMAISQSSGDCKFQKNEKDEFTGDEIKVLKNEVVGKMKGYRLSSNLGKINGTYGIYLQFTGDLGCVSTDSYVILKFESGETLEIANIADIDCGSRPQFIGLIDEPDISLFRDQKIEKVRYSLSERYADIDITMPDYFTNGVKCLE